MNQEPRLPSHEETGNPAEKEVFDVVVIGGGPAGSTAALYAARASLSTLVVDKGTATGALALAARVSNYPGVPDEVKGIELLERMRAQAQGFGARFVEDKVILASLAGETKEVRGAKGVYRGRTVVVATGALGRAKTIPGEERLAGRGVSYCATCDGFFFRDQDVAVVGATQEATEEALFLAKLAKSVHLLVPTPKLTASPRLTSLVDGDDRVQVHVNARLREVLGDAKVEGVRVGTPQGERTLPVAGVFLYLQGREPITDFLQDELTRSDTGGLVVDDEGRTSVSGVFAAGDVVAQRLRQVVIAAAQGATAAVAAERYLTQRRGTAPTKS
jgi:thioredoxin reductase (NADPH)